MNTKTAMPIKILLDALLLALLLHFAQCYDYEESMKRDLSSVSRARRFTNEKPRIKYRFTGADGQYLKFRSWVGSTNRRLSPQEEISLSFQFQTKQPDSILLYLDDGGASDFIALTLVSGEIHLRFKFGVLASVTLRLGAQLNNQQWHQVAIKRRQFSITLAVDRKSTSRTFTGPDSFSPRSKTYFGGLPGNYKLQSLSLSSIFFKTRFIGQIRQIMMNGKLATRMEKFLVREDSPTRPCSDGRNPCENNGKCYYRDGNIGCECSMTSYTGKYCTEIREEAVATFRGQEWLSFDLTQKSLSSYDDEITLSFKTKSLNGLLFHTGQSADYVTLFLKDGIVVLVVNLGSGAISINVQPIDNEKFNDGKWHSVRVSRTLREVNIVVDQANIHNHYIQDDYTQLTLDDVIYVGGSPRTETLPGTKVKNNFIGCMKEVAYSNTDGRYLSITRLAKARSTKVSVHGTVQFTCQDEIDGPISFLSPESSLKIQLWQDARRGSIEFQFQTTEQNGVLAFSSSKEGDLFAIELYGGLIYIVFNLGSGISPFEIGSAASFSDGRWHKISVSRVNQNVTATVDGIITLFRIKGKSTALDNTGPMYLGGANFPSGFSFTMGLKNAPLRKGFVGCVNSLKIDSIGIDLQSLVSSSGSPLQLSPNDIVPYCKSMESTQCTSAPCSNGGVCKEKTNRFECDCSMTSYAGKTCNDLVTSSRFNGSQAMILPLNKSIQTDAEEISMRFKTLISAGLLFATSSNTSRDTLIIQLVRGGKLLLYLDIGQGPDVFINGENLNDGKWHSVKVSRRGHRISLGVDGREIIETISGQYYNLEFDVIHLGMYTPRKQKSGKRLRSSDGSPAPFVGFLENLVFNKISVIDSCASGTLYCKYNNTLRDVDYITAYSVTFSDENSYVVLPTLQAYSSMSLSLSFKTTIKEGLILYNGGNSSDYVAVELVEGILYYIYNLGNGEKVLSISGRRPVNNNEWHDLKITRSKNNQNVMTVDGRKTSLQGSTRNIKLDLSDNLYIGGISKDLFRRGYLPDGIVSRVGYQGCLANIDLNGQLVDLMSFATSKSSGNVFKNCSAPRRTCDVNSCRNGGNCVQQWNDIVCDCSMTAYVGPRCNQRGFAFVFQRNPGVMLFQWLDFYPSPREDNLSLGFSSTLMNALLFKVTGNLYKGVRDYLELALVKGKLTLKFNIGSTNVTLVEPRSVTDGQYHKCLVRRKWMNASMRVNNWPVQMTSPNSQRTNTVFSSQSMIQIGGIISKKALDDFKTGKNLNPDIKRPFKGQMAGFFFNDVRVFELAVASDPRITIIGDVQQIGSMISTTPSFSTPTTTMAMETTFTTTKTLIDSPMNDSGCDVSEMCNNLPDNVTEKVGKKNSASIVNSVKDPPDNQGNITKQTPLQSTPSKETQFSSMSLITIIGVAGSCLLILVITLIVMCCRKREHIYNVNKETMKHEKATSNGSKHLVVNSNGSVIKEKTTNVPNHNPNKEVLV